MPDPVADLVRLVRERIASAADPDRAEPMRAYMKSAMPYRGLTSVPLRAICKATYDERRLPDRDAWESAVRELWDDATYREERYAAMALTRHRHYRVFQDPATVGLYRHLVVSGAWWDYVDSLASHNVGDLLVSYPAALTPVLRDWASTTICGCGAPRSSASCGARTRSTSPCCGTRWRQTWRTAGTAGSSSCARRSAGRCGSTPAKTRAGCGRSSPSTRTGCPACRDARLSSTCDD
jgi:hypothetical protein